MKTIIYLLLLFTAAHQLTAQEAPALQEQPLASEPTSIEQSAAEQAAIEQPPADSSACANRRERAYHWRGR